MRGSTRQVLVLLAAALLTWSASSAGASASTGVPATTPAECEAMQLEGGVAGEDCQTITKTTLVSSANPATAGQPLTYTAIVSPVPDGGTVSLSELGVPIPGCEELPVSSSNGTAICTVTYPTAGNHTIQAIYLGDTQFRTSQSGQFSQVVDGPPAIPSSTHTSVVLHSSKSPTSIGQVVLYTATITPAPPGGVVDFTDDQISIPSCQAVDIAKLSAQSATASCTVKYTTPGIHQVRATYSGEGSFLSSESAIFEQAVTGKTDELLARLSSISTAHAGRVRAKLQCISLGPCKVSASLTTTVSYRGGRSIAVSAKARRRRVAVGSSGASIASGRIVTVTIVLNAASRHLLARFHRLPAELTISVTSDGQRTKLAGRRITITH